MSSQFGVVVDGARALLGVGIHRRRYLAVTCAGHGAGAIGSQSLLAGHRLVAAHAAQLGTEAMAVAVDLYGVTPVEDLISAPDHLDPATWCW